MNFYKKALLEMIKKICTHYHNLLKIISHFYPENMQSYDDNLYIYTVVKHIINHCIFRMKKTFHYDKINFYDEKDTSR